MSAAINDMARSSTRNGLAAERLVAVRFAASGFNVTDRDRKLSIPHPFLPGLSIQPDMAVRRPRGQKWLVEVTSNGEDPGTLHQKWWFKLDLCETLARMGMPSILVIVSAYDYSSVIAYLRAKARANRTGVRVLTLEDIR